MSAMTKSDVYMMLDEMRSTLDSEGHCILADGVSDIKESYRKLAEREKALTEALKEVIAEADDASQNPSDDWDFYDKAHAALALHKEDA